MDDFVQIGDWQWPKIKLFGVYVEVAFSVAYAGLAGRTVPGLVNTHQLIARRYCGDITSSQFPPGFRFT